MQKNKNGYGISDFEIGQPVLSIKGRDKGCYYLVVGTEKTFLFLADGRKRGICNPKRKNLRHVQLVQGAHWIAADFNELMIKGKNIKDLEIRNSLNAIKIEAKGG